MGYSGGKIDKQEKKEFHDKNMIKISLFKD